MRISCAIVSYNNGTLLEEAIMSVLDQTRPVDEIIVADDASTDGSRQLIEGLSHKFPKIRPILRDRNLGVTTNRDLALRQASGDLITFLDGDDRFLPTKIAAESKVIGTHEQAIAFSDVRIVDRARQRFLTRAIGDFSALGPQERVRWLLVRTRQSPAAMLMPKHVHLRIGGHNRRLQTYEDWDYILRLAAEPLQWVHSGAEGLVHHPGGGLSNQRATRHMLEQLRVLRVNRELARHHVGLPTLAAVTGKVIVSGVKWTIIPWLWETRRRLRDRRRRN